MSNLNLFLVVLFLFVPLFSSSDDSCKIHPFSKIQVFYLGNIESTNCELNVCFLKGLDHDPRIAVHKLNNTKPESSASLESLLKMSIILIWHDSNTETFYAQLGSEKGFPQGDSFVVPHLVIHSQTDKKRIDLEKNQNGLTGNLLQLILSKPLNKPQPNWEAKLETFTGHQVGQEFRLDDSQYSNRNPRNHGKRKRIGKPNYLRTYSLGSQILEVKSQNVSNKHTIYLTLQNKSNPSQNPKTFAIEQDSENRQSIRVVHKVSPSEILISWSDYIIYDGDKIIAFEEPPFDENTLFIFPLNYHMILLLILCLVIFTILFFIKKYLNKKFEEKENKKEIENDNLKLKNEKIKEIPTIKIYKEKIELNWSLEENIQKGEENENESENENKVEIGDKNKKEKYLIQIIENKHNHSKLILQHISIKSYYSFETFIFNSISHFDTNGKYITKNDHELNQNNNENLYIETIKEKENKNKENPEDMENMENEDKENENENEFQNCQINIFKIDKSQKIPLYSSIIKANQILFSKNDQDKSSNDSLLKKNEKFDNNTKPVIKNSSEENEFNSNKKNSQDIENEITFEDKDSNKNQVKVNGDNNGKENENEKENDHQENEIENCKKQTQNENKENKENEDQENNNRNEENEKENTSEEKNQENELKIEKTKEENNKIEENTNKIEKEKKNKKNLEKENPNLYEEEENIKEENEDDKTNENDETKKKNKKLEKEDDDNLETIKEQDNTENDNENQEKSKNEENDNIENKKENIQINEINNENKNKNNMNNEIVEDENEDEQNIQINEINNEKAINQNQNENEENLKNNIQKKENQDKQNQNKIIGEDENEDEENINKEINNEKIINDDKNEDEEDLINHIQKNENQDIQNQNQNEIISKDEENNQEENNQEENISEVNEINNEKGIKDNNNENEETFKNNIQDHENQNEENVENQNKNEIEKENISEDNKNYENDDIEKKIEKLEKEDDDNLENKNQENTKEKDSKNENEDLCEKDEDKDGKNLENKENEDNTNKKKENQENTKEENNKIEENKENEKLYNEKNELNQNENRKGENENEDQENKNEKENTDESTKEVNNKIEANEEKKNENDYEQDNQENINEDYKNNEEKENKNEDKNNNENENPDNTKEENNQVEENENINEKSIENQNNKNDNELEKKKEEIMEKELENEIIILEEPIVDEKTNILNYENLDENTLEKDNDIQDNENEENQEKNKLEEKENINEKSIGNENKNENNNEKYPTNKDNEEKDNKEKENKNQDNIDQEKENKLKIQNEDKNENTDQENNKMEENEDYKNLNNKIEENEKKEDHEKKKKEIKNENKQENKQEKSINTKLEPQKNNQNTNKNKTLELFKQNLNKLLDQNNPFLRKSNIRSSRPQQYMKKKKNQKNSQKSKPKPKPNPRTPQKDQKQKNNLRSNSSEKWPLPFSVLKEIVNKKLLEQNENKITPKKTSNIKKKPKLKMIKRIKRKGIRPSSRRIPRTNFQSIQTKNEKKNPNITKPQLNSIEKEKKINELNTTGNQDKEKGNISGEENDEGKETVFQFNISSVTPTNVVGNWHKPVIDSSKVIDYYEVKLDGANKTIPPQYFTTELTNLTIKNLLPNTKYLISIKAQDSKGFTNSSKSTEFTTLSDIPEIIHLASSVQITSKSITLKWKQPNDNGKVIDNYKIKLQDKKSNKIVEQETNQPSFRFRNLIPNNEYYYQIQAHNELGYSEISSKDPQANIIKTLEVQPNSSKIIKYYNLRSKKCSIQWKKVPNKKKSIVNETNTNTIKEKKIFKHYKIILSMKQFSTKNSKNIVYFVKRTKYDFNILIPNTKYFLQIEKVFTNFPNKIFCSIQFTTMPDKPEKIEEIKTLEKTSDQLSITWTKPIDNGEPIIQYFINVYEKNNNQKPIQVLHTNLTQMQISFLKPNLNYYLTIVSQNSIGNSLQSGIYAFRLSKN
ncbi:fibronectin type iii domain-containing protein 3b [Anaeramoeba flamelloides]|uniref:Fibronectin type iii domain-containing protein 3b n=1 Tax=Anaeramoeba flamelloides TaxID=1746091 RepID=A0AAV7ZEN8_9EUKA|nr:fibronectin type iii domain-containing protein 3b [Anaeramoeba flamelloides]